LVPLDHLELVCTGGVVYPIPLAGHRQDADVDGSISVRSSGWCVLRASADHAVYPVFDLYPYATTSPIYITVAGRPAHSASAADYFLAWIDRITDAVRAYPDWNASADRQVVDDRLQAARAAINARR